jgi:hypothetical protein
MVRRVSLLVLLGLLVAGLPAPGAMPTAACSNTQNVWFLGAVYDAEVREDFQRDVDNFERYKTTIQDTYCIPEDQTKILAFFNDYTRNGKTYETASKANVLAHIAAFGAAASAHPDSIFFYFHASHGLVYLQNSACSAPRPGSFAAMGGGNLYDCELGNAINANFAPHVRMFIFVDCSFCGGFSDSLTAASGTVPDGSLTASSGIPGPNRIVGTGCAITTECFGDNNAGGVSYKHLTRALNNGVGFCDGYTAPGFPMVQGINVPVTNTPFNPPDGRCTASEWFYSAVRSATVGLDPIAIQQQYRLKYGMGSLADDILIV